MAILIPKNNGIEVFSVIVDINRFSKIVSKAEGNMIAQFIRDVLSGGITAVQKSGGEVVGFMGDAFFAIISDPDKVFACCVDIAKDLDRMCEYISKNSAAFPFSPTDVSLKIGIEFGYLDISDISSNFLGNQKLFIGDSINYAARITAAGKGNRCLVGPKAFEMGLSQYIGDGNGPHKIKGKLGEPVYNYYQLPLGDIWIEGASKHSFWG